MSLRRPQSMHDITAALADQAKRKAALEARERAMSQYVAPPAAQQTLAQRWATWTVTVRHQLLGSLPPNYTLRQKVMLVMEASPLGRSWDVFQTALSLFASMMYVRSTYAYPDLPGFDESITFIFTADYFARLYAAPHRLRHVVSFFACIGRSPVCAVHQENLST